jgi:hypothetical protein
VQVEEARRPPEGDDGDEAGDGQQSPLTEESSKLVDRHDEGNEIDTGQSPLDDQATQPGVRCVKPVHVRRVAARSRGILAIPSTYPLVACAIANMVPVAAFEVASLRGGAGRHWSWAAH